MDSELEHSNLSVKAVSLDSIRQQLEFTKSEFAATLKVDPASLTRWTKDPEKVPPYILQSLSWYLELRALRAKGIDVHSKRNMESSHSFVQSFDTTKQMIEIRDELRHWKKEASLLKTKINENQSVGMGWKMALLANTLFVLGYLLLKN